MTEYYLIFILVFAMHMCCLVQGRSFRSRPPMTLKLWKHQVEVSARSLRVKFGSEFSVTCDGSAVGSTVDPHLRWYGTDKMWIAYEGKHERFVPYLIF